jgi:hypothetical protein
MLTFFSFAMKIDRSFDVDAIKEWTSNRTVRDEIQHYVELGYNGLSCDLFVVDVFNRLILFHVVLYSLVIIMAFLVNPFLFFYYEEKREEKLLGHVCSTR